MQMINECWVWCHDVRQGAELRGFILFDHFKETVHGILDGFGIDKPFYEMAHKGERVAWSA